VDRLTSAFVIDDCIFNPERASVGEDFRLSDHCTENRLVVRNNDDHAAERNQRLSNENSCCVLQDGDDLNQTI